jgi:apolipoprotein N-acyltransferase
MRCGLAICGRLRHNTAMLSVFQKPSFKTIAVIFGLGLLSALAMPPSCVIPALIPVFTALLLVLKAAPSKRMLFFAGFAGGLGYHLAGLYWIGNAMLVPGSPFLWAYPLATTGLPLLFAIYYGVVMLGAGAVNRRLKLLAWEQWILLAGLLGLMEWVRSWLFTGYPWNLPAYTWFGAFPVIQSLAVFGPNMLTLLTFMAAMLPALFVSNDWRWQRTPHAVTATVLIASVFIGLAVGGALRLGQKALPPVKDVFVQIVQPNISQAEKWDQSRRKDHFETLMRLSAPLLPPPANADETFKRTTFILWPETALSGSMLPDQAAWDRMGKMIGAHAGDTYLLSGTLRQETNAATGDTSFYNSMIGWDKDLTEIAVFDKFHLVPFGEYMPLEKILHLSPVVGFSGFAAGDGPKSITLPGAPTFSPLICYEVIFPHAIIDEDNRPHWLVNITNDGWYGNSTGPYQHWAISRARTIEEGLPMIRSANTGISGVIDPFGRELVKSGMFEGGSWIYPLPSAIGPTLYARWGETVFFLVLCSFAAFFAKKARKNTVIYT